MQASLDVKSKILIALVLMSAGRAMTLAFITRAGDGGPRDPPEEWLMPLIGDAVIGLAAIGIAWLLWRKPSPGVWLTTVVWTAVAAFDAIAGFIVETTSPWPEFFMLEIFGRSMFFAATAMHLVILYLLLQPSERSRFGVQSG